MESVNLLNNNMMQFSMYDNLKTGNIIIDMMISTIAVSFITTVGVFIKDNVNMNNLFNNSCISSCYKKKKTILLEGFYVVRSWNGTIKTDFPIVIDALFWVRKKMYQDNSIIEELSSKFSYLDPNKKLILVTGHRRESFGDGFKRICEALRQIANIHSDVQILYPVHLNPNVQEPVNEFLNSLENVILIEPQQYLPFCYLMDRSYIILTDSGGIQEEAPSLGKPVLVMRDTTERPEAIDAGTVKLVGTDVALIVDQACSLLNNPEEYQRMSKSHNPYGDGLACGRILDFLSYGE